MKYQLVCAFVGASVTCGFACGTDTDPTTTPGGSGNAGDAGADAALSDSAVLFPTDTGASPPADASAAVDGEARGECGQINDQAQVTAGPVDIVLGLDTSGSMWTQICNVSQNLTRFADGAGASTRLVAVYEMGNLGGLTALFCNSEDPLASTALASDTSRYLHDATEIGSTNALEKLLERYPTYSSFLRADAATHFVVVSDDQSDLPGGEFATRMQAALGHPFYFHAIVADGMNNCFGANVGTEYLTLAEQTGGLTLPMCATDWGPLFDQLQAAVIASAPLPCDFAIPTPPSGQTLDTDAVQVAFTPAGGTKGELPRADAEGACGTNLAWHYDDPASPKRIELCPSACDAARKGGKIGIAFGCEPAVLR